MVPSDRSKASPSITDARLDRARGGDREAVESILLELSPLLERFLSRFVFSRGELEDILQSTYLAIISALPRFRGEAKIETWATRISVRVALAHMRRRSKHQHSELFAVESGDPEPTEALRRRRQLERVQVHLSSIKPKKRIAFVLHAIEGYSMNTVAAMMDASVTATKSRVFWARKELLEKAKRDDVLKELLDEVLA